MLTLCLIGLSIGTVVYAFSRWKQLRFQFFALLCIAVSFYTVGYYLEMTATTFEGALVGCKVIYFGSPLTGSFFYLFARDYSGRPRLKLIYCFIICLIPMLFVFTVLLYPDTNVYYTGLEFYSEAGISDLIVTPGPFYVPCIVYVLVFSVFGIIEISRAFLMEKRFKGAALFFLAVLLPTVVQPIALLKMIPYHYNPMPAALVFSTLSLSVFMVRYRQIEWQSIGRDQLVQDMDDAFLLLDRYEHLIDYNSSAADYFPSINATKIGRQLTTVEGFPVQVLAPDADQLFGMQRDGQNIRLRATTTPIFAAGSQAGTSIVITDETERQHLLDELTRLARHDGLTGLNNRATFFNDAALSFALIGRQKDLIGCALMLDIDYFKQINDNYGHAVGDVVLRYIGGMLLERLRSTDISGRYGGEEFCVWMPATDVAGAQQVAEIIRKTVQEKTFVLDGHSFRITVSIGLACSEDAGSGDFEDLINKADDALYQAKNNGRNQVVIYNPGQAVL